MTTLACEASIVGHSEPRLWTPPLVPLTPATSFGFEVVEFAEEIGRPLLPWQQWAVIHGGELLPDGRPRFRIVLLIVARQNGKTELPVILSVWWQFVKGVPLILGTSTQLSYAKESWSKAVDLVRRTPRFDDLHEPGRRWLRRVNGEVESWTIDRCRYKIAAANDEGGRSLTVHRGIADELRQHKSYAAWDAIEPACSPPDAQIWALSNAGSDQSVVLNDLREQALGFIDTGEGDERLGLMEWSSWDGADPEDVEALCQANPRVGYGLDLDVLLAGARRAKRLGGEALAGFKTERMCQRVRVDNPAVDPHSWGDCLDPGDLAGDRLSLAACVDVSLGEAHATLAVAAVLPDGRVRVEVVHEWDGPTAPDQLQRDLPGWVARLKPQMLGWFPAGPAAVVAAKLADRRRGGVRGWPPRGVTVEEIRGETTAVCMGFGKEITAGTLAHSGQAGLDAQVVSSEKLPRGDGWVFTRRGDGDADAVYAVAGAVHLARTLPTRRAVSRRIHVAPGV